MPNYRQTPKPIALSAEQNHRCAYCGVVMRFDVAPDHPDRMTTDHVVPVAKEGPREWHNEVAACRLCNGVRGDRDAYEFYAEIVANGRPQMTDAQRISLRRRRNRNVPRVEPLPPPPFSAQMIEYLAMAYGAKTAADMVAERREIAARFT